MVMSCSAIMCYCMVWMDNSPDIWHVLEWKRVHCQLAESTGLCVCVCVCVCVCTLNVQLQLT